MLSSQNKKTSAYLMCACKFSSPLVPDHSSSARFIAKPTRNIYGAGKEKWMHADKLLFVSDCCIQCRLSSPKQWDRSCGALQYLWTELMTVYPCDLIFWDYASQIESQALLMCTISFVCASSSFCAWAARCFDIPLGQSHNYKLCCWLVVYTYVWQIGVHLFTCIFVATR